MSIETLTGDEFMNLDADDHRVALDMYNYGINQLLDKSQHAPTKEERDGCLDQLTSMLTLRKVHKHRLAELEDEEPAAMLATEQYRRNELAPAL